MLSEAVLLQCLILGREKVEACSVDGLICRGLNVPFSVVLWLPFTGGFNDHYCAPSWVSRRQLSTYLVNL